MPSYVRCDKRLCSVNEKKKKNQNGIKRQLRAPKEKLQNCVIYVDIVYKCNSLLHNKYCCSVYSC